MSRRAGWWVDQATDTWVGAVDDEAHHRAAALAGLALLARLGQALQRHACRWWAQASVRVQAPRAAIGSRGCQRTSMVQWVLTA